MKSPSVSQQKAIWHQCRMCVAADKGSFWVNEIEGCQGYSCSLYHLRPVHAEDSKMVYAYRVPLHIQGMNTDLLKKVAPSLLPLLDAQLATEIHEIEKTSQSKGFDS
ncbi:MAG: hypothetical protein IMF09_10320 [Proteobacteria bacterium]|nr:hypothetical protein [Pseudomonadota bacterium]